jgi:hypothetical protein
MPCPQKHPLPYEVTFLSLPGRKLKNDLGNVNIYFIFQVTTWIEYYGGQNKR